MYNFLSMSAISSGLIVLIFIFISFFCLFLYIENHKLKEKIEKLELENKKLLETKVSKQKNIDSVSINKISIPEKKNNNNQSKKIELIKKQQIKENVNTISNQPKEKEIKQEINIDNQLKEKKLYQKNVLHDKPNITSSVTLTKIEDDFDLNEFIKTNELKIEKNNQKEENIKEILDSIDKKDIKITNSKKNNNVDYLQEISNKMADELKPQTIELTDYEKLQEENAIISYKELITLKDKIMMLDDEDETINFIEELKNLRNSLK